VQVNQVEIRCKRIQDHEKNNVYWTLLVTVSFFDQKTAWQIQQADPEATNTAI